VGRVEFFAFFILHFAMLVAISSIAYKLGWRAGSRREVMDMIELLDALKIDNWEQSVFRDRFKGALQWTLDRKRKKDRNATPPANPPTSP
jgi:hypothetical protein